MSEGTWLSKVNRWIARLCWYIIQRTAQGIPTESTQAPDLCPTNNARNIEHYTDRLNELLINRASTVREIALTAPYSGGKSSFINTFIERYAFRNYTCISLAAFKEGDKSNGSNLEQVQKSILQQILYRTKSANTPNSRFRRIFPSPLSYLQTSTVAVSIVVWLLILIDVRFSDASIINKLLNTQFSNPLQVNGLLYGLVGWGIGLPMLLIRDSYQFFHKHDISKFNLSKGEVAFTDHSTDSVFNIHLEEIIYYFQATKSDVVIFEDLDRFESTEIFIKLKELNKLINDSADVVQDVRFIYALKDDVFTGKNRTKFFDAIIPIIPITHASNSYPQLKKLITDSGFSADFNDESGDYFLRDIAIYIDDMRMLKNIVAEYGIYKRTLLLSLESMDLQKLFGFIIYKNCYSDDFALLHDNNGKLADFLKNINILKKEHEAELSNNLEELKQRLIDASSEIAVSIEELNTSYIGLLIKKQNLRNHNYLSIEGTSVFQISDQAVFEEFSQIRNAVRFRNVHNQNINQPFNFDEYFLEFSYEERKLRVLDKAKHVEDEIQNKITKAKEELQFVKNRSAKEVANSLPREKVFKSIFNDFLLIRLIEKGYIDEHYHLYTSHFHEGETTRNDQRFVRSVKDRLPIGREYPINNHAATLEQLSIDEFKQISFLNYSIVDYLLLTKTVVPLRLLLKHGLLLDDERLAIVQESFTLLEHKTGWLNVVCEEWPQIWSDIINSSELINNEKLSLIVDMLIALENGNDFSPLSENESVVRKFINENEAVADNFPVETSFRDKLFEVFSHLNVQFYNLALCKQEESFLDYVLKYQAFTISAENIAILVNSFSEKEWPENLDFSRLNKIENSSFVKFKEDNLDAIVNLIAQNHLVINEGPDVIEILNHENVELSTKSNIIENVDFIVANIKEVIDNPPLPLELVNNDRVKVNWPNTFHIQEYVPSIFLAYLNRNSTVKALCEGDELAANQKSNIASAILEEGISQESFIAYNDFLNYSYSIEDYQSIPSGKFHHLIESGYIQADIESYDVIRGVDSSLSLLLLEKNFKNYLSINSDLSELDLDSNEFDQLIESKILTSNYKKKLIHLKSSLIDLNKTPSKTLITILKYPNDQVYKVDSDIPLISVSILRELVQSLQNEDDKIRVLIGQLKNLDDGDILLLLDGLKISPSDGIASIKDTGVNRVLAEGLKLHGLISNQKMKKGLLLKDSIIELTFKNNSVIAS